jgi:hypothetical protein
LGKESGGILSASCTGGDNASLIEATAGPGALVLSCAGSQEICKAGSSVIVEAEVAADGERKFAFHGGITKKRFWIIFSGK